MKTPTFSLGDIVKSSATSGDHVMGLGDWRAVVTAVRPSNNTPDGHVYETTGWLEKHVMTPAAPTRRQLWSTSGHRHRYARGIPSQRTDSLKPNMGFPGHTDEAWHGCR